MKYQNFLMKYIFQFRNANVVTIVKPLHAENDNIVHLFLTFQVTNNMKLE